MALLPLEAGLSAPSPTVAPLRRDGDPVVPPFLPEHRGEFFRFGFSAPSVSRPAGVVDGGPGDPAPTPPKAAVEGGAEGPWTIWSDRGCELACGGGAFWPAHIAQRIEGRPPETIDNYLMGLCVGYRIGRDLASEAISAPSCNRAPRVDDGDPVSAPRSAAAGAASSVGAHGVPVSTERESATAGDGAENRAQRALPEHSGERWCLRFHDDGAGFSFHRGSGAAQAGGADRGWREALDTLVSGTLRRDRDALLCGITDGTVLAATFHDDDAARAALGG